MQTYTAKEKLDFLLAPRSIALIGASNREGTLGYDLIKMILQGSYRGGLYPINPKYDDICGLKCYPNLEAIGQTVDMAVLCVNAKRVEEQAKICLGAGVRALTVFANCVLEEEAGSESQLEDRLIALCEENGVPLLGHNAMGYYNNDIGLRVCGFDAPDANVTGHIALCSQSGSVLSTIGHNEPQLRFNFCVATGTGQVTSLEDYIDYALELPTTRVVGVFMESVRKPQSFISALKKAREKRIPIALMKVGKSELGAQFAQSHTGGLAGDDDVFDAIFAHYGAIRCQSLQELTNTLLLFSLYPNPPKGDLVAIADSGGERNLLADVAEDVGLKFAKLSDQTMAKLADIQEYTQEAANPLDPWGTGIGFEQIIGDSLTVMLGDGAAAIGVISQDMRDGYYLSQGCVNALKSGYERVGKPVVFMTNLSGTRRADMTAQVRAFGAGVLVGSHESLAAIRNWLNYRDYNLTSVEPQPLSLPGKLAATLEQDAPLGERQSLAILSELGLNTLPMVAIEQPGDLAANRDKFIFPAVLKTAAEGILHKADVGGVVLKIADYGALEAAYAKMSAKLGPKAIVAPMFSYSTELIFGVITDPDFGPFVVVGAGGIYTEVLRDRIVLPPTAGEREIREKLATLKTYPLLTGVRGMVPADIDRLVGQISKFCAIAAYLAKWAGEIDVNPVAVNGEKIVALDALIIPHGNKMETA
ncbi:MAG: acetate--CoA ligase family protein [Oscillospiraceae bacterium]|nr:acetate--CoA ligase family protein [Oscillospiraceae bacterium]